MATVLIAWELGAGLGHLTRISGIAAPLIEKGHRVVLALRDLTQAYKLFDCRKFAIVQAPFKLQQDSAFIAPTVTYNHMLHNVGFRNPDELEVLTRAWLHLLEQFAVDVVVLDHSPTALFALRTCNAKRVLFGDGFAVPPSCEPLSDVLQWVKSDPATALREERRTLASTNEVLRRFSVPPMHRLADMFEEVDDNILTTYPHLDHFGPRTTGQYYGPCSPAMGKSPEWPAGNGRKIFAYLKPFAGLEKLLEYLAASGLPTVVFSGGIDRALQENYACLTLRFESTPLNLYEVGEQCDLAILNATHGTTCAMLAAGIPVIAVPLYVEQLALAHRITQLGVGLRASPKDARQIINATSIVLGSDKYRTTTQTIASQLKLFPQPYDVGPAVSRIMAFV